jgi:Zn-finger protein
VAIFDTEIELISSSFFVDRKLTCLVCEVCNAIHYVVEVESFYKTRGRQLLTCETCSHAHRKKKFVEINKDIFDLLNSKEYELARMSIFMNKIENGK